MPGGRPKGSVNKNTQKLRVMLRELYPDYHPVIALAKIAHESDDETLVFNAHKEVAQYIEPKLKALEIKNDSENPFTFNVTLSGNAD